MSLYTHGVRTDSVGAKGIPRGEMDAIINGIQPFNHSYILHIMLAFPYIVI